MNRPPPISSPSSSIIHRPSLISGLSARSNNDMLPWTVDDASLRPVPPLYPPLNSRNTVFVSDVAPSVVAARISECLRKRNVSVEYDDEAHTATCLSIDRVHFTIQLFRGSRSTQVPVDVQQMLQTKPDFSHGVIVECIRVRGDTISFHHHCRDVLAAAAGHADGTDTRAPIQTSVLEYKRLVGEDEGPPSKRARLSASGTMDSSSTATQTQSLEHCIALLKKDRIDAQQLGMQSLVALTDFRTSGVEAALHFSLAVLGSPVSDGVEDISKWITSLVQDRVTPGEDQDVLYTSRDSYTDTDDGARAIAPAASQESSPSPSATSAAMVEDSYHGGMLRALALRALCNALSLVAQHQPQLLRSILSAQSEHLVADSFLSALVDDLAGATRPPLVVVGTRLASAHEATLATICIRLLAEHSEAAMKFLSPDKDNGILDALEKARAAGRSSHEWLACESEKAYLLLSQDIRTC